jgi:hypothetical protein
LPAKITDLASKGSSAGNTCLRMDWVIPLQTMDRRIALKARSLDVEIIVSSQFDLISGRYQGQFYNQ